MTEELTGQAGGVGEGEVTGGKAEAKAEDTGVAGAPSTAEGAVTPIAKVKVDLTESAEFRSWQASRDRREAQLQGQVTAGQQQVQEMQARLAELQLANADPEEVVAFYQQQLASVQAERAQVQQAQTLRQEVEDAAGRLLAGHGLDVNTPGLDWDGGASWEGYAKLAESVAKIEALKASEAVKMTSAEVSQAAQVAKAEALAAAGVTKVNTATGAAVPKDLRAEYETAKAALVGTGDVAGYARLKSEYRKKGLEV
jgi:hypothetical protein